MTTYVNDPIITNTHGEYQVRIGYSKYNGFSSYEDAMNFVNSGKAKPTTNESYGTSAFAQTALANRNDPNAPAGVNPTNTNPPSTPSNGSGLDIITDPNTKQQFFRYGANDTYKPISQLLPQTGGAPTNANNVSNATGTPTLPYTSPTFGNVSNASASIAGVSSALDTQMKAYQDQLAAAEKQQQKTSNSLLSYLKGAPSQSDMRTQGYKDIGIDPTQYFADQKARIAEIDNLTKDYNAQVAAKDQAIAGSYDQLASNSFINNRIAQIERNAAPRLNEMSANINAKAATLQALQGNFAQARSFVDQAVQDAVADRKFKVDLYTTMYQMNQDQIDRLDKKYQDAFDKSFQLARDEYQNALDEKKQVGNLMVDNPQAGILITDTLDQAYAKVGLKPQPQKGDLFGSSDSGYYERYYDPTSNTYKVRLVKSGTGSSDTSSTIGRDLADAAAAIQGGGDKASIRRRFLEYHPKEASVFDTYIQGVKATSSGPSPFMSGLQWFFGTATP